MIGKRLDELERVIELYQDALFRFAFFRTGSLADSQDIVQNVFLKMVDSSRDLAHVGDLKNYLFRCLECLLRLDGKKAAHRDSSAGKRGCCRRNRYGGGVDA